jgi:hypothetical protein
MEGFGTGPQRSILRQSHSAPSLSCYTEHRAPELACTAEPRRTRGGARRVSPGTPTSEDALPVSALNNALTPARHVSLRPGSSSRF